MGWKDKMKEFGGGDLTFLSSDGECLVFTVVADPVLLHGKFRGKEQDRIGCPVMTDEGFMLFVCGKRVGRKISKFEDKFKTHALIVVRHGETGDVNCTYNVKVYDNDEVAKRLHAMAKTDYKKDLLTQAIKAADECMNQ